MASLALPLFLGASGISQAGEAALGDTETEEWSQGRGQGQRGGGGDRAQALPAESTDRPPPPDSHASPGTPMGCCATFCLSLCGLSLLCVHATLGSLCLWGSGEAGLSRPPGKQWLRSKFSSDLSPPDSS